MICGPGLLRPWAFSFLELVRVDMDTGLSSTRPGDLSVRTIRRSSGGVEVAKGAWVLIYFYGLAPLVPQLRGMISIVTFLIGLILVVCAARSISRSRILKAVEADLQGEDIWRGNALVLLEMLVWSTLGNPERTAMLDLVNRADFGELIMHRETMNRVAQRWIRKSWWNGGRGCFAVDEFVRRLVDEEGVLDEALASRVRAAIGRGL